MTVTVKSRAAHQRTGFDARRYGRLLAQTVPVVIHSAVECKRASAEIDRLLRKGSNNLSPEEER